MSREHAPFSFSFVYAALAVTLTAGLGYAAVLGIRMGFGLPSGVGRFPLVQAHGHAQLWGWTGLFIIGVSLYFAPRLMGTPLRGASLSPWICGLLASGILVRTVAQPLGAVYRDGPFNILLRCGVAYSAAAETAAVGMYAGVLFLTMRTSGGSKDVEAVRPFRFYMAAMLGGWCITTLLSGGVALHGVITRSMLFDPNMVEITHRLYLGLVLLPVTMIFSIRTFPLYLRLPRVQWPVQTLGVLYLCAFGLAFIPSILRDVTDDYRLWAILAGAGRIAKAFVLLWFVWELDILLRRKAPWTVERTEQVVRRVRKQPRAHLPDYGEFGRFERLLYSAYLWLTVGAVLDGTAGLAGIGGRPELVSEDALRHIYLLGFVSLLLLGMAPRMIPGFMHRRALAYPGLVNWTFRLGNLAVACRVLPHLMPAYVAQHLSAGASVLDAAFGLSGVFAWLTVLLLAWNLTATCRGRPDGVRNRPS